MGCVLYTAMIFLFCVLLRCLVSFNSYSGFNTPPMFGDYEAQRHWMEITLNLPTEKWYVQSEDNDLLYWGLDYPPLTAYHSMLCGILAHYLNPDWVALNTSRGYESYHHKMFMRHTVLFADVIVYFPAIFWFHNSVNDGKRPEHSRYLNSLLVLSYPGLILIDHGHFHLGFVVFAILLLLRENIYVGSMFFVLALNYKQMELYHSLPFFFYLLGKSLHHQTWRKTIITLVGIGTVVILTFLICWLPFLTDLSVMMQVLQRLFPFNRGLFEDKVANIWCSISVIYKLKSSLGSDHLIKLCTLSTIVACLPSSLNLLRYPTKIKFLYALINSSLAFFLFSYQAHEKSILLVALPVCLVILRTPLPSIWFLLISTFSMYPLLERDGQAVSYFSLSALFILMAYHIIDWWTSNPTVKAMACLSLGGCGVLHLLQCCVPTPNSLPDIYPLLFSIYSCTHFIFFLIFFNYTQWTCPNTDVTSEELFCVKLKES